MNEANLVQRTREELTLRDTDLARRVVHATLRTLAEACSVSLANALARTLPDTLALEVTHVSKHDVAYDASSIGRRVSRALGLPPGRGLESAEVVCRIVGDALDDETLARLERELQPSVSAMFARPERRHPISTAPHGVRTRRTLSSGHPGFARPISSSHPPPSGETHEHRLAVAHGTRQEDAGETLSRRRH